MTVSSESPKHTFHVIKYINEEKIIIYPIIKRAFHGFFRSMGHMNHHWEPRVLHRYRVLSRKLLMRTLKKRATRIVEHSCINLIQQLLNGLSFIHAAVKHMDIYSQHVSAQEDAQENQTFGQPALFYMKCFMATYQYQVSIIHIHQIRCDSRQHKRTCWISIKFFFLYWYYPEKAGADRRHFFNFFKLVPPILGPRNGLQFLISCLFYSIQFFESTIMWLFNMIS